MLTAALVIACKELIDGARDHRSLFSMAVYSLMGPAVVFMVSGTMDARSAEATSVLISMASIFVLVAAFVGGLNLGIDVLAGERERRSLLPLLLNGVSRNEILIGKWLAVSCSCVIGLALTLAGFGLVSGEWLAFSGANLPGLALLVGLGLVPLCLFAAAIEVGISTACSSMKVAHSYLSMLAFIPMIVGMFLVFHPATASGWLHFVPIAGHQWQLERWMRGDDLPLLQAVTLAITTFVYTIAALAIAANLLERDDVVYGR